MSNLSPFWIISSSYFSHFYGKIPEGSEGRKEGWVCFGSQFKGLPQPTIVKRAWWPGRRLLIQCPTARKQRPKRELRPGSKALSPTSSDLLLPVRIYILNVPQPSQPSWGPIVQTYELEEALHIKTTALLTVSLPGLNLGFCSV